MVSKDRVARGIGGFEGQGETAELAAKLKRLQKPLVAILVSALRVIE